MAMNKTEAARMAALEQELRVAKALRWSNADVPAMIPPPKDTGTYVNGWRFSLHKGFIHGSIHKAWSDCASHGLGEWREEGAKHRLGSQGGVPVYPSRHAALVALRQAFERQCAERLAEIDAMIERGPGES